jgi:PPP family 3-phenylpropionic acid transporter
LSLRHARQLADWLAWAHHPFVRSRITMPHYRQWSAVFASYFTILGLWTAFGPTALMASDPGAAPLALAAITLAYFVATPFVRAVWMRFGFAKTLVFMGGGVCLSLCSLALVPQWLAWCMPASFFFGSGAYTLCETKMLEDLARSGQGHAFGRARKWGSFGFLAAASMGGAVFSLGQEGHGFSVSLALCGLVYFACAVALARAHRASAGAPLASPKSDKTTGPTTGPTSDPLQEHASAMAHSASHRSLARRWLGASAVTGMRLGEAISTTWFGAYWLHTGHSPLQTGLLCALPVAAEFLAMWKGGGFLQRTGVPAVLLICSAVSALRWLATPFCTQLWCALPLQSLHAFSFGFFYPASLVWLKHAFGAQFFQARYATESAARALTAGVSYLAAGWVIASFGYGAIFGVACALALLCALWWLRALRS